MVCASRAISAWLELSADLPGEVAQTREVGLHRVELAQRLLLATTVLEDAGRLLDEAAAILRRGLEHGVEPTLTHDDVHLPTQAGVAEQLLHIEQTAALAVDGVLAGAVAEERAADGDLGVLDRQRAVGIVDRELHLGAPEGTTGRGAGEDDVFHLPAAEGLRPLLPHHPREGVDDIRLAGAVRSDDARDAGLEHEGRGLRERLEPLERQALQVHGATARPGRFTPLRYRNPAERPVSRAVVADPGSTATRRCYHEMLDDLLGVSLRWPPDRHTKGGYR